MFASHYSTLGLSPGASREEVRRAYRRLVKNFHPDLNGGADTTAEFLKLQEAYRSLSGISAEAESPPRRKTEQRTQEPPPRQPNNEVGRLTRIRCFRCGRPAAQPRSITFWTIRSMLLFSVSRPTHGLFCAACARHVALKASVASALYGWWSVTGLLKTPYAIFLNAVGGDRPKGSDKSLLWHSAMIFYSRGELALAHGLAAKVAASKHPAQTHARLLMERIRRRQPSAGKARLNDPWLRNWKDLWLHALLALSVPAILMLLAVQYDAPIRRGFAKASVAVQSQVDQLWPGARRDVERRLQTLGFG